MFNKRIREAAKASGVHLWQIAERYGVSEFTFSRKLRKELPEAETVHILDIISQIEREVK